MGGLSVAPCDEKKKNTTHHEASMLVFLQTVAVMVMNFVRCCKETTFGRAFD